MSKVERVRLAGDVLTHDVAWADADGGYTRCGLDFKWFDNSLSNASLIGAVAGVDAECDCMTCLVGVKRMVGFTSYQTVGIAVFNPRGLEKLDFACEETKTK